jgi:hypothetical protein
MNYRSSTEAPKPAGATITVDPDGFTWGPKASATQPPSRVVYSTIETTITRTGRPEQWETQPKTSWIVRATTIYVES